MIREKEESKNMLSPRKQKYRKQMRGTMKGNATRGLTLAFGDFGLSSQATRDHTGKRGASSA